VLALSAGAPYPLPASIRDTADLRFAAGPITKSGPTWFEISTPAGPLVLEATRTIVLDEDRCARELSTVIIGREVRVWYEVNNGALAREVDLVTPQPVVEAPKQNDSPKSATGSIEGFDKQYTRMVLGTPAGPVTFQLDRITPPKRFHKGEYVTVTYVAHDGAHAKKIERATPPPAKPVG
jgi:hypothetical protein